VNPIYKIAFASETFKEIYADNIRELLNSNIWNIEAFQENFYNKIFNNYSGLEIPNIQLDNLNASRIELNFNSGTTYVSSTNDNLTIEYYLTNKKNNTLSRL
jgi:hypothetical protein